MSVTITKEGKPVSTSRNLRGVMTYARKHGVRLWIASMTDDYGALVSITFGNGADCHTRFASWDVAQRWVRARRSWALTASNVRPTCEVWEVR